jgi:exopolyphosphatase / guanosine-5'-triphosphate,3'-diphosphate pyrophosphatase
MTKRLQRLDSDNLAAIDIGTNAVRLEMARLLPDGSLEVFHSERDPVRPGEGVFATGKLQDEVANRLLATLRRYSAMCRRYRARVRAVATSALREAKNRSDIVQRARKEASLQLEIVSGKEEARLICLGVLKGAPPTQKSLCIDLGGGSTEIISALGEKAQKLWSVDLGAVRVTELFGSNGQVSPKQLKLMRHFANELLAERVGNAVPANVKHAIGSSGTIGAVVGFARRDGAVMATTKDIERASEALASMDLPSRRKRFDSRRADIIVAGSVILESVLKHFSVQSISSVDKGLREGLLNDLAARTRARSEDTSLVDEAIDIGRKFQFSEGHALQVARLSLSLFDQLVTLHKLSAAARPLLEVAALLHDVGHSINYQKHHKHSHYLILNAELPWVTDRERLIIATIARFHRRSPPATAHELMAPFNASEVRTIRKCATLLRIADSIDLSHRQPVVSLGAKVTGTQVLLTVRSKEPLDLEAWDLQHETQLFREVFGKRLQVIPVRVTKA